MKFNISIVTHAILYWIQKSTIYSMLVLNFANVKSIKKPQTENVKCVENCRVWGWTKHSIHPWLDTQFFIGWFISKDHDIPDVRNSFYHIISIINPQNKVQTHLKYVKNNVNYKGGLKTHYLHAKRHNLVLDDLFQKNTIYTIQGINFAMTYAL